MEITQTEKPTNSKIRLVNKQDIIWNELTTEMERITCDGVLNKLEKLRHQIVEKYYPEFERDLKKLKQLDALIS